MPYFDAAVRVADILKVGEGVESTAQMLETLVAKYPDNQAYKAASIGLLPVSERRKPLEALYHSSSNALYAFVVGGEYIAHGFTYKDRVVEYDYHQVVLSESGRVALNNQFMDKEYLQKEIEKRTERVGRLEMARNALQSALKGSSSTAISGMTSNILNKATSSYDNVENP